MSILHKSKYYRNYLHRQNFCQHIKEVVILKLKRKDVEQRSEIQLIFSFSISPLCNQCNIYHISIREEGNPRRWTGTLIKLSTGKCTLRLITVLYSK